MHKGVSIFPTDASITPADLAVACEERGFESLWVAEHSHIPVSRKTAFPGGGDLPRMYFDVMDPFVCLASAATVTRRLKVATGVCLLVQRDPIQTAKQVASLDRISNGRFLFGIGGGWNAEEMANHGTRFDRRFRLLRERLEAMKAIWTQEKAEYHGELVDFDPVFAWPKPVQKPYPPVHVGGAFPAAARRAIRPRSKSRSTASGSTPSICTARGTPAPIASSSSRRPSRATRRFAGWTPPRRCDGERAPGHPP